MTTLEQVKTYVQNHLVAVVAAPIVATSVLALVAVTTTIYHQTKKNGHQTGFLSIFNLKSYEVIKKVLGSKKEKTSGEEYENYNGDENEIPEEAPQPQQQQQPPVDEAKDQH